MYLVTTSFTLTDPDFSHVKRIEYNPLALTFAVRVCFTDGATCTASLSGSALQDLLRGATEAAIPCVELCHFCQQNPASPRWTIDGDVVVICNDCAEIGDY
jgi:hypothetical protein